MWALRKQGSLFLEVTLVQKKTIGLIAGFAALAGVLVFASAQISKMTDSLEEDLGNDSIFVLEVRKDLPEGLEHPFADPGETAVSTPPLWKVTNADGSVMYMSGSIHYLPLDAYPIPNEFLTTLEECDTLAVESYNVDSSRMFEGEGVVLGDDYELKKGDTLKNHLTDEQYTLLTERLVECGKPADYCDGNSAWYACQVITELKRPSEADSGLSTLYGTDTVFQITANQMEKEVLAIETNQSKQDLFNKLDDEMAGMLIKIKCTTTDENFEQTREAWASGDYERIYELNAEMPEAADGAVDAWARYLKLYIDDRNQCMVDNVEQYMADGRKVFLLVGLAHFGGENGIVRLLERDGCTVERII